MSCNSVLLFSVFFENRLKHAYILSQKSHDNQGMVAVNHMNHDVVGVTGSDPPRLSGSFLYEYSLSAQNDWKSVVKLPAKVCFHCCLNDKLEATQFRVGYKLFCDNAKFTQSRLANFERNFREKSLWNTPANYASINFPWLITSVVIIIAGVSLSEQHTDLLICHNLHKALDLSHTNRYLGIT